VKNQQLFEPVSTGSKVDDISTLKLLWRLNKVDIRHQCEK
jgi:hypothetical protein